jgi:hypothetical protein
MMSVQVWVLGCLGAISMALPAGNEKIGARSGTGEGERSPYRTSKAVEPHKTFDPDPIAVPAKNRQND